MFSTLGFLWRDIFPLTLISVNVQILIRGDGMLLPAEGPLCEGRCSFKMTCWHFLQCAECGRLWSYNPHLIYIIQQAGGPLLLLNGETLPSSGDVSGLKENPHHPATGGPWAQWENEDLCAPLNPQEFLIKHRSRAAEGPLGPHPPPVRGLPLWQGEWSSPLHFVLAAGYQGLLFTFSLSHQHKSFLPIMLSKPSGLPLPFIQFFR